MTRIPARVDQGEAEARVGAGVERARAVGGEPPPRSAPRSSPRCRCTSGGSGRKPCSPSASHTSRNCSRSNEFAATPPPRHRPFAPTSAAARRALRQQHVDDCLLERRGDVGGAHVGVRADVAHDRGLEPAEREVEALVRASPAGTRSRSDRRSSRAGRSPGRPGSRDRGTARPCRTPPRRRRRSSGRAAGTSRGRASRRASCDHPTRAARPRAAAGRAPPTSPRRGAPRGGSRRRTARPTPARAPSRRSRRRAVSRRAPGRRSRATASMRSSSMPASTIACAITGVSISTCARPAISGTTPPKRAWRSTWLDTTDESTFVPPMTTAAAVSSQLVSMPRMHVLGVDRDRPHGRPHSHTSSSTTVVPGISASIARSRARYAG